MNRREFCAGLVASTFIIPLENTLMAATQTPAATRKLSIGREPIAKYSLHFPDYEAFAIRHYENNAVEVDFDGFPMRSTGCENGYQAFRSLDGLASISLRALDIDGMPTIDIKSAIIRQAVSSNV